MRYNRLINNIIKQDYKQNMAHMYIQKVKKTPDRIWKQRTDKYSAKQDGSVEKNVGIHGWAEENMK